MKKSIWILFYCLCCLSASAQYYLRGEVRNEHGILLDGVKLRLASTPLQLYYSGSSGAFGIPSNKLVDSLILQLDGYENLTILADTRKFQFLQLKTLPGTIKLYKNNRSSVITNLSSKDYIASESPGESYSGLVENKFIKAAEFPETGFSLNIDNASYSNIRRFITNQMYVPEDAIRIEEMLNYFSLPISKKEGVTKTEFSYDYKHTTCPWKQGNQLLFLQFEAPTIALTDIPPSNLVFLIDISGSMDKPNRLPLLQSAFKLLINNLRECDTITIVTYGGGVGIALAPTGGVHKAIIKNAIDSLSAGGDTPGSGAIQLAYQMAKKTMIPGGNNRVILATDGDFNVGQSSEKELEDLIMRYQETGIYLTCLGVGMGNYKDSKLESLSKKGNGNFAYIDQIREAEKVMVTEFTKNIFAVANDASISIRFNPKTVASYRLIGFDNKKTAIEDSTSILEGGEIGSGHSIMAIVEITPTGDSNTLHDQSIASIQLKYKEPSSHAIKQQLFTANYQGEKIELVDSIYRFAASVAMFGSVLRKSKFMREYQFEDVLLLANTSIRRSDLLQNEFGTLIEQAIKLYQPPKKKRKRP